MSEQRKGPRQPTREEVAAGRHKIEWMEGWQYATTHRIMRGLSAAAREAALSGPPEELLIPPDGEGWERNVDRGDDGYEAVTPSWCVDDSAVQQRVFWRRPHPGLESWNPKARLHVARKDVHL